MFREEEYLRDRPELEFPDIASWLRHIVSIYGDRTAIRYRSAGTGDFRSWTYERLGEITGCLGQFLIASGTGPGDRVALWAENRPEWCFVWLGTVAAGMTIVPIDAGMDEEDVLRILMTTEAKMLFTTERRTTKVESILRECPGLREVILIDGVTREGSGRRLRGFEEILASDGNPLQAGSTVGIQPDTSASIIFTSGTTGIAKGVELSHHGIIANVRASNCSLSIHETDVFAVVLPLHHTYPTTCSFLTPLAVGASLTICDRIVGKIIVDDIRDSGCTFMVGVPLLFDKLRASIGQGLRKQPAVARGVLAALGVLSRFSRRRGLPGFGRTAFTVIRKKAGLGSLRLLVSGGGPLSPSTADFFDDLGFPIVQGYGMSENGPLISTNTERIKDNRSVGLPVKDTEVAVLQPDDVGIGEIIVRSPSLMKGYFRNPEATREMFTPDGFLKTGDIGYIDRRGFIYITGRSKNIIVTAGGKNVYPEEIEAKFDGSRAVLEVLILGRKETGGNAEEVVAVCVPNTEALGEDNPGIELTDGFIEDAVKASVRSVNRSLPAYAKISCVEIRKEEFEKTSSKKIRRHLYRGAVADRGGQGRRVRSPTDPNHSFNTRSE